MFRPALSFPRLALLSLPLLVLVGCSSDPNAPMGSAITSPDTDLSPDARPGSTSTGWYPLTLGGLWHYDHQLSFTVTPTGGAPGEPVVVRDRVIHDLIRTEVLMERTYVVELQRTEAEGETPILEFVRYRQDRAGLYEADVPRDDPPGFEAGIRLQGRTATVRAWDRLAATTLASDSRMASYKKAYEDILTKRAMLQSLASGALESYARPGGGGSGVQPGEIQRLKYALKAGVSWTIRPDPLFSAACEAREDLILPVGTKRAFRVRVTSPIFGPNDRAYFWYSQEGLLKFTHHFEGDATDELGNVIGTVVGDETKIATMVKVATQD